MITRRLLSFVMIAFALPSFAQTPVNSEQYQDSSIGGWKIKVNRKLLESHRLITTKAEGILQEELSSIEKLLPAESIPYLKEMAIWLEFSSSNTKSIQYHL